MKTTTVIGGADQKEDFAVRPNGRPPFDFGIQYYENGIVVFIHVTSNAYEKMVAPNLLKR